MKRISILGATGSIGQSTIDLIRRDRDAYRVVALTGGRNVARLAHEAKELQAEVAVIEDAAGYAELRDLLAGTGVEVAVGSEAIVEAASRPADWIMSAIVGAAGLAPGWQALEQGVIYASVLEKPSAVSACGAIVALGASMIAYRRFCYDSPT